MAYEVLQSSILSPCASSLVFLGTISQLRVTARRGTTLGLSLTDAEGRLWGRLPWLLYAASLRTVDWPVFGTQLIGCGLASIGLYQFLQYPGRRNPRALFRVALQFSLLSLVLLLVFTCREGLRNAAYLLAMLPVAATGASLCLGAEAQLRTLLTTRDVDALSINRYNLVMLSYACWICYGFEKRIQGDWSGAWTILTCSVLGLAANAILLFAVLSVRRSSPCRVTIHNWEGTLA